MKGHKQKMFWIGMILFLGFILIGHSIYPQLSRTQAGTVILLQFFFSLIVIPVLFLSIFLISLSLILNLSEKRKGAFPSLIILFVLWGLIQLTSLDFFLIAAPFEKLAMITKSEFVCKYMPVIKKVYKNKCYQELALAAKNADICNRIDSDSYDLFVNREKCYTDIAYHMRDELICEKIDSQTKRNDCYISLAQSKEDESICEKIILNQEQKDICYYNMVWWAKKDTSLCEKIVNPSYRSSCYNK